MKLQGNTILLTGGSAGIGLALAKEFLALGNKVIITGRNADKLEAARKATPELETIQCDAADPDAVNALAAQVDQHYPDVNVLVNNAGVFIPRNHTVRTDDLVGLTSELDINVAGPIRTVSVLIDRLKANRGTIINVSSGLAFVPIQLSPIYCATKAALHSYTITLRHQLKDQGVEVIELMPPAVQTKLTADLPDDGDFKIITTEQLITETFKGLRAGREEIRPGQANQLYWMSRIAPGFINGQMEKGSKALVPAPVKVG
jgi:uncharacterized oxidoreductase